MQAATTTVAALPLTVCLSPSSACKMNRLKNNLYVCTTKALIQMSTSCGMELPIIVLVPSSNRGHLCPLRGEISRESRGSKARPGSRTYLCEWSGEISTRRVSMSRERVGLYFECLAMRLGRHGPPLDIRQHTRCYTDQNQTEINQTHLPACNMASVGRPLLRIIRKPYRRGGNGPGPFDLLSCQLGLWSSTS